MKRLFIILGIMLMTASCSEKESYTSRSARMAAERYYTMLLAGDYAGFVDGIEVDSMPADYREQMIDMVAEFAEHSHRGGLTGATITRDSLFNDSLAYVFLDLCYGDSTSEEVLLPMVFENGQWLMR